MITQWNDLSNLPDSAKGLVVAVGNFDGVHLGHQTVITTARQQAHELATGMAVLTFAPSPYQFFNPNGDPNELTPLHVRAKYMAQLGVQHLYVQNFNREFSEIEDKNFIQDVLRRQLNVRHVVVGENFRFGHHRTGDVDFLVNQSVRHGFGVTRIPPMRTPGGPAYSSTRVRKALQVGDPEEARQILGRPFEIEGVVRHGSQQGGKLGFRTANLTLGDYVRPQYGVYAVKAAIVGTGAVHWRPGVANLGIRPSFEGKEELFEVHLFDLDKDLYDTRLRVQLWHYLRPEEKFGKLESLKRQIARDVELAKQKLGA